MSELGFKKVGYSNSKVTEINADALLASPVILERLNKFAQSARVLAPKSDDFLYFTIIFLKSAEAALIDEEGNLKKLAGGERAWGYFDDNYSWHGNVRPHRNNNGDIFPEGELKKAARDWIGMPLCVDHKSESVDGIRGIILDTYYDEKHKQVVGLCALDKVTYPNLARKVQTGVVRYGSMGTAVSTSICSDCGNRATTPNEYCQHVITRSAYGEVNIGLKPMEYSLVVQPAEPGARLLQCIASIGKHKKELVNYGVRDFETFSGNLSLGQAEELDQLLKVACGPNGCSIDKRASLINGYLKKNDLLESKAQDTLSPEASREVQFAKALSQLREAGARENDVAELYRSFGKSYENEMSTAEGETFTSGQSAEGRAGIETFDSEGVRGTGGESTGLVSSDNGELVDSFDTGGVVEHNVFSSLDRDKTYKSVMEDIMKESKLRKRAELRRRLAYYYGGAAGEGSAEPVEPSTFKSEEYKKYWMDDKHMHQDKPMGGDTGTFPGDMQIKEQQKRAELAERRLQRRAYFYGGAAGEGSAEPVEPATFKSEDYKKYWMDDKHMHQDKPMGGDSGAFPGDIELKKQLKRAKLSTKFKQVRALNGTINKDASAFEVYADGKLVLATTARDIYGPALEKNWGFLTSREYGKAVVAAIREEGLRTVASKLAKTAQGLEDLGGELPPAPEEGPGEAPLDEEPLDAPELPEEEGGLEEGGDDPSARIDEALVAVETAISDIRGAVEELGGSGDVEINVEQGQPMDEEKIAVSRSLLRDLKVVLAESSESADELALISEAFENKKRIPAKKLAELRSIASDALNDAAQLSGEARTLLRMARVLTQAPVKTAEYIEDDAAEAGTEACMADDADANEADDAAQVAGKEPTGKQGSSEEAALYSKALEMRKARREAMIAAARKKVAQESDASEEEEEASANSADDGAGHAQRVAETEAKGDSDKAVPGDKAPTGSSPRAVAEKAPTGNMADDGSVNAAKDEDCEEAAEEEVEEHEEDMHGKDESEANDVVPNDGVQSASFVTEQQPSAKQGSSKLNSKFMAKKAEEERERIKLRMRRAYDLAMDMQRKGLIAPTRASLDTQVDLVLEFDDRAFEAFKRSVANAKAPETVKTASDLGGVNIGYEPAEQGQQKSMVETLSSLFK